VTTSTVIFFFETILYTSKTFLMGTISSRILHQLRDIYSICRCRWNVLSNTYWLYIWVAWLVSSTRQDLLTLRGHLCLNPGFLVGSALLIALCFFCVVRLCVFTFLVPCCDVRCDFPNNNNNKSMFNSFIPPVVIKIKELINWELKHKSKLALFYAKPNIVNRFQWCFICAQISPIMMHSTE
jgi:hypothetical protein